MSLVSFFLVQIGHLVWLDCLYPGSLSKVMGAERSGLLDLLDSTAKGLHCHLRCRNRAGEKEDVEKLREIKKMLFWGQFEKPEAADTSPWQMHRGGQAEAVVSSFLPDSLFH